MKNMFVICLLCFGITSMSYGQAVVSIDPAEVASPAADGLFDMSGNVWEWCLDEYNGGFYAVSPSHNPVSGANSIQWILDNYTCVNTNRVLRGGAWFANANYVRVAYRNNITPTPTYSSIGFRCARVVQ